MTVLPLVFFATGFFLLIRGTDFFVTNAARIARRTGFSPLTIGFVVMGFGTSVPELFVGISASISGNTEIVLGNAVGSSIASLLLVPGVAALFCPIYLYRKTIRSGILFILIAAGILWIVVSDAFLDHAFFSVISRSDGLILLCFFCIFSGRVISFAGSVNSGVKNVPEPVNHNSPVIFVVVLKGLFGCLCLAVGSRFIVDSGASLAKLMGISERVMGMTVIALGTALPQLATCIAAARRGFTEIVVGTVSGAVFFNIFFVLGVSALIRPIAISPLAYGDMGMLTLASFMLFVFLFAGNTRMMGKSEGGFTISLYLVYIGYLLFPVIGFFS
ncbi:calcium/sodium antiporter [Desulfosarcina sp. OttesenSCG-928-A07]|nr:calcium/sodium antiporter [Desulfosarcina sp. OttesenSCG-928-A07]